MSSSLLLGMSIRSLAIDWRGFGSSDVRVLRRLRVGLLGNLFSILFNQGSTFLINIIAANALGRDVFGQYTIVLATIGTVAGIAQLASGYAVTRYIAEYRSNNKAKAGRICGLFFILSLTAASVCAVFLFISSRFVAVTIIQRPELIEELRFGSLIIVFMAISGLVTGTLAGLEAYKTLAKAASINGITYIVSCGAAISIGGLNALLVGIAISSLIQCAVLLVVLRVELNAQQIQINYRRAFSEGRIITKFVFPSALSGFLSQLVLWLSIALLATQPDGYKQLALYGAAASFRVVALFIPNTLQTVVTSILNHEKGSKRHRSYLDAFRANIAVTSLAVVTVVSICAISGPWLLRAFGRDFVDGYPVLLLLLLAAIPEALTLTLYQSIIAMERMWLSLYAILLPHYGAMFVTAVWLIPRYGAIGLAAAYVAGWTVSLTANITLLWRYRSTAFSSTVLKPTFSVEPSVRL